MPSHGNAEIVDRLLTLPDPAARRQFLQEHVHMLDDQVAEHLKEQADQLLRADLHRSQEMADLLLQLSELTENRLYRALGLLAEANARALGLGEYQRAIDLYDEAAAIYRQHERPLEEAKSQVGKVGALAFLGQYSAALEIGDWAGPLLESHEAWRPLATLTMNLAIMHARKGEDALALTLFDRAGEIYWKLGQDEEPGWLWVQLNRAYVLRNLGRFKESVQASETARDGLIRLGQEISAARAQQMLALTYFVQGKYNRSLESLDQVRETYLSDGRRRDAMLVELFISDCLLKLRRFQDVLEKCRQVRALFTELGTRQVIAQAILNEAAAYAQLAQYPQALESLAEARQIFEEVDNRAWATTTDLETASVLLQQGEYEQALALAGRCVGLFQEHNLPVEQGQSAVVAGWAALRLGRNRQAQHWVADAQELAESSQLPTLLYQAHHLEGALKLAMGQLEAAQKALQQAIQHVEALRGGLMIEFRVGFLEDKAKIYEDLVDLCLQLGQPELGLAYAERSKSRALLDLLAYRLDLSVQARGATDQPLVEELERLRAERDRVYRRWESDRETDEGFWIAAGPGRSRAARDVVEIEGRITELWHRLLIRNADYAREAALWTVRTEDARPYLAPDAGLVEYFTVGRKLLAFLVTREEVRVRQLDGDLAQIQTWMQLLHMNLAAVLRSPASQIASLTANAQTLLQKLHAALLGPLVADLEGCQSLIVVPHGPLHYLPFHALYDGQAYLAETHEISYLPGASFLRYSQEAAPAGEGLLSVGHSDGGRLSYAVPEARAVADRFSGRSLLEDQATLSGVQAAAPAYRTAHFAVHGDFRPDNPLFSGLKLADSWLTTLDIFNLRLQASLVTLSACQTGRNVVAGGDELLGLMRAFLGAGAASLVLSLWAVEDRSTGRLMAHFYEKLARGWGKGAALRAAQLRFIQGAGGSDEEDGALYRHPYFWGAFFLVGDTGPL